MSLDPRGYGSSSDAMWTNATGDERVKQILADVARQVEQTSVKKPPMPVPSEAHSSPAQDTTGEINGMFLSQAVGHDPADHIPPDHCLLGCTFFIAADYLQSFASSEIESWSATIRKLGGQVEQTYSSQITHVLCSSQFLDAARAALMDVKRVVTAYWLVDAIKNKRMNPPTRATHLPCPFMPPAYPLSNILVTVSGFTGADRMEARLLLAAIGAIYTNHLTPRHTVLIAAKPSGPKYENAVKWNIPVVNAQWLKDVYFGNMSALKVPVAQQYLLNPTSPSNADCNSGQQLRLQVTDLPNINPLFSAWKHYLKVPRDALKRRMGECQTPEHRPGSGADSHRTPNESFKRPGSAASTGQPRIMLTGFSAKAAYDLTRKVRSLGGTILDAISTDCTHLVAPSIVLTPKFLAAFSCCRYVVAPEWIEASFIANTFLPESGFQLRDPVNERLYGCNLLLAHERASKTQVFEGFSFFISPTVQPRPSIIRMLISAYGGSILASPPPADALLPPRQPTPATAEPPRLSTSSDATESSAVNSHTSEKDNLPEPMEQDVPPQVPTIADNDVKPSPSTVVIANPQDLPFYRDLYPPNVPIHSVELILTACLRQELNLSDFIIPRS